MSSLFRRTFVDKQTGTRRKTAKWYGKYTDADGVKKRVPLSPNKAAAQMMLNDLVAQVEREKAGVRDPFKDYRKRPLSVHLEDWERILTARANTADYVGMKVSRARKVIEACGFVLISDLSASAVEAAIADMRQQPRFGVQTANHYLAAVKQFARWLVADRRTADNPLSHLAGGNVKLDRRHDRRELDDDELGRLFAAARHGSPFRCLVGPDREMLYVVAVYTGLRASELASLTPQSFDLSERPTVIVGAAYSKHRREDVLPLHADVVRFLQPWLSGRPAAGRLWAGKWASGNQAGVLLKRDLAAARAAWIEEAGPNAAERGRRVTSPFLSPVDDDGRVVDFHSLRHTFITRLVKAGVKPKDAQTLARHSTITLTMDRYAHVGIRDVAAAMDSVPAIRLHGTLPESVRMTGTDNHHTAGPVAGPKLAPTSDRRGGRLRVAEVSAEESKTPGNSAEPLEMKGVEDSRRRLISGEGGIL